MSTERAFPTNDSPSCSSADRAFVDPAELATHLETCIECWTRCNGVGDLEAALLGDLGGTQSGEEAWHPSPEAMAVAFGEAEEPTGRSNEEIKRHLTSCTSCQVEMEALRRFLRMRSATP